MARRFTPDFASAFAKSNNQALAALKVLRREFPYEYNKIEERFIARQPATKDAAELLAVEVVGEFLAESNKLLSRASDARLGTLVDANATLFPTLRNVSVQTCAKVARNTLVSHSELSWAAPYYFFSIQAQLEALADASQANSPTISASAAEFDSFIQSVGSRLSDQALIEIAQSDGVTWSDEAECEYAWHFWAELKGRSVSNRAHLLRHTLEIE